MGQARIKIDIVDTIAVITLSGPIQADEIIKTLDSLFQKAEYVSGCSVWDFRKAQGESTFNEIRKIAQFAGEHRGSRPEGRVALVVSSELHFGLSRIYQALTEGLPFHIEIFKSFGQALSWAKASDSESLSTL